MIINSSKNLYGSEGAGESVAFHLRAAERATARFGFSVVMQTRLQLSATETNRANLQLRVVEATEFALSATEIARAALRLENKGELAIQAVETVRASVGLRIIRQANNKLILTVRIVPKTRVRRHKDLHRFSVNGAEVPISDYSADFPDGAAGCVVSVTLAKFADRRLVVPGASYKFELAKRIGGAWQWRTLIDSGVIEGSTLTIGFGDRKRADVFTLSTYEPLANRLGRSPLRDLTVYDPLRVAADELNTEIVYDTEGTAYVEELKAIPNLTVYKLLEEIFKVRCGFPAIKMNFLDSPLKEARFTTGETFMDGVAPAIGNYEPDFTDVNGVLWIRDTTNVLPDGFPLPTDLTLDDYNSVALSASPKPIDCFEVVFYEDKDDWDYFEPHVETLPVEKSGTNGREDYSATRITRTERRYFKNSQPDVPVKIDLYEEERETRDSRQVTGRVTETFFYDAQGRVYRSTKVFKSLVPAFDDGDSFTKILATVREEKTTILYGRHPFEPSKQVQLRKQTITYGQIAVDAENPYEGEDFRQPMIVANRSGNISESSTAEYGPIEKLTETVQILPGDQLRTVSIKEDLVSKNLEYAYSDVSYGDASSAQKGRTRKLLVFRNPGDAMTGRGKETLPVGELPPEIFIPLARRKLKKRDLGSDGIDSSLNGLELWMDRGTSYTIYDEKDDQLGVFTVRGFRFFGSNLGTRSQAHKTQFRAMRVK